MGASDILANPTFGFWITIYAVTITVATLWLAGYAVYRLKRRREVTWDLHTEYIDISEFSNRNIPLRVTYKGTEPKWWWATYLSLRNTGQMDILEGDQPEKQHFIVGEADCRYIGFNRLISEKAKVTLSPLFIGNDVYCKIEFDRLGPGDEIYMSLLFVAEDKADVKLEGNLFGANSRIVNGQLQRMQSWRSLWWLLITMIAAGGIGGGLILQQAIYSGQLVMYHLQTLLLIYFLALIGAAVLLRPIRFWQQIPERFHQTEERRRTLILRTLKFILGLSEKP